MDRKCSPRRWDDVVAHRDRLLRLARSRGLGPDDAEDVVHEALLRCATFEALDEERLGQLLTTVTIRLCVDEHRRRERATRLSGRLPVDPAGEPPADEAVCARAEAEWAASVVGTLPPIQQAIIAARAEGLSYEEISRRHRVSYKSVESAASRARATVRRALAATLALAAVGRRHVSAPAIVATAACTALTVVALPPAGRVEPATVPARRPYVRVVPTARQVPSAPRSREPVAGRPARPTATAPAPPRPEATPTPIVEVGDYRVGPDERDDDHTTAERVSHCVTHGIEISPTIRCRYPDESPPEQQ